MTTKGSCCVFRYLHPWQLADGSAYHETVLIEQSGACKLRQFVSTSGFEITKRIASENKEWTAESIGVRQAWMADQATAIWRIAQLSG